MSVRLRPAADIVSIRPAALGDIEAIRTIEREANAMFDEVDMAAVARLDATSVDDLSRPIVEQRAWVATDEADRPVGFVLASLVDENAHVEQISVASAFGRRGIGTRLLDAVIPWAREHGCAALTLTTFSNVPWNAPYYARRGFRVVGDDRLTPGLARLRDHNATTLLGRWSRVTMRRELGAGSTTEGR